MLKDCDLLPAAVFTELAALRLAPTSGMSSEMRPVFRIPLRFFHDDARHGDATRRGPDIEGFRRFR